MTIERAIILAATAHEGIVDKGGHPYILHLLRVMMKMPTLDAQITAVLHDVAEDTDWLFCRLEHEGVPSLVVAALRAITRRSGEDYFEYIHRLSDNPLARTVKMADLEDNSDLTRIQAPTKTDYARKEKYTWALAVLHEGPVI